jgi:demethylmenaquinone methyltransferase/2-methoxy-6-polyprenyl-1,4-benzoquinol methylase
MRDPRRIRRMFAALAPRYNLLNHLLSGCLDRMWRRSLIAALDLSDGARALDVCAGTAHLAAECLRRHPNLGAMVVSDFVPEMLALAPVWLRRDERVAFVAADALHLPFPDAAFDASFNAFGLRNTADPATAVVEMVRVVKPGGAVGILEFFQPPEGWWRTPAGLWTRHAVPLLGRLISPHPEAYAYLPQSMNDFLSVDACAQLLADAGCEATHQRRLTGGVATAVVARKR